MNIEYTFDKEFTDLIREILADVPEELVRLEGIHPEQLDINHSTRKFFRMDKEGVGTADVSIDGNANVTGKDTITYAYELSKPSSKLNSLFNLWKMMKKLYGEENAKAAIMSEILGHIYINDSWDIGKPYCFNFSCNDILCEGLKMSNRLIVDPPKSLQSFLHQVEQFVVYAANSTLGATGLADLLIIVGGFYERIKATDKDHHVYVNEPYTYVKEALTSLIYTLNWEFRGNQSAFTNVSVYDRPFLDKLLPSYQVLGKPVEAWAVQTVQDMFLDCMNEVLDRCPITFPVTTACFSVKKNKDGERVVADEDFLDMISSKNLKYAFINIYMGETSTLSSCCRLRSNTEGLGFQNSFGSGSTKIGSLGVVTLNLPRMAKMVFDDPDMNDFDDLWPEFLQTIEGAASMAQMVNNAKREFLKDRIERGALPLYKLGFMDLKQQYSTCGFTGLYEALDILGWDINTPEGLQRAKEILLVFRKVNEYATRKWGTPHNTEQVPAETSSVKLCAKDRAIGLYDDCDPETIPMLYSNQFVPVWDESVDFVDRIRIQGQLDQLCDGGSILHLNMKAPVKVFDLMRNIIKLACHHGVVYFALNYVICQCRNKHIFVSSKGALNDKKCPVCGSPVENEFTRVVGFLTNTKHWNATRQIADYPNRHFYGGDE